MRFVTKIWRIAWSNSSRSRQERPRCLRRVLFRRDSHEFVFEQVDEHFGVAVDLSVGHDRNIFSVQFARAPPSNRVNNSTPPIPASVASVAPVRIEGAVPAISLIPRPSSE